MKSLHEFNINGLQPKGWEREKEGEREKKRERERERERESHFRCAHYRQLANGAW